MSALPPDFNPAAYRKANASVREKSEEEVWRHWLNRGGPTENRRANHSVSREVFATLMRESEGIQLEIGPNASPLLLADNVEFSDFLDSEGIRTRCADKTYFPGLVDRIPHTIHYVGTTIAAVPSDRFSNVFSSHCIEHQPDLLGHLREVARVLKPGGRYLIVCPDMRYCFDHHTPATTITDVICAHAERRTKHTVHSALKNTTYAAHNDPHRHWRGDHGAAPVMAGYDLRHALHFAEVVVGEEYHDAHAWQFTPETFREQMEALHEADMLNLRPLRVYPTQEGTFEFYAVLEKV